MSLPEYRTSRAQWDGALPHTLQCNRVTASGSGVVTSNDMIVPCDGYIAAIIVHVITDGAAGTALINVLNGATEIVVNYSIDAIGDGSILDLAPNIASAALTLVSRGDRLTMNIENVAAGAFAATIVIMPR